MSLSCSNSSRDFPSHAKDTQESLQCPYIGFCCPYYFSDLMPTTVLSPSSDYYLLHLVSIRATMRSPLRSPAQVEGTQGVPPQPEKDLERPSSTRLEARFPYFREPAYCILSAYCIFPIECSTFHSIIFQGLE